MTSCRKKQTAIWLRDNSGRWCVALPPRMKYSGEVLVSRKDGFVTHVALEPELVGRRVFNDVAYRMYEPKRAPVRCGYPRYALLNAFGALDALSVHGLY